MDGKMLLSIMLWAVVAAVLAVVIMRLLGFEGAGVVGGGVGGAVAGALAGSRAARSKRGG